MMTLLLLLLGCCAYTVLADPSVGSSVHSHCEYDIIVLLDSSGSIEDNGGNGNFNRVKDFARTLVEDIQKQTQIGTNTRVGITSYSNRIVREVTLASSLTSPQIIDRINSSEYMRSETRMVAAIEDARQQFRDSPRSDVNPTRAVVLFTDGIPSSSVFTSEEKMENALQKLGEMMDDEIYVVMVGIHMVNDSMLRFVESYRNRNGESYGFQVKADNFNDLVTYRTAVIEHLHIRCVPINPICDQDIFLLVDTSGSIGRDKFNNQVRPFAQHLFEAIADRFPIGPGRTRVGVSGFSRGEQVTVELTDGTSAPNILDAIGRLLFSDSWTHLVEFTMSSYDTLRANIRAGVTQRLIIITDGFPTSESSNPQETQTNYIQQVRQMTDIEITLIGFNSPNQPSVSGLITALEPLPNVQAFDLTDLGFSRDRADVIVRDIKPDCTVADPPQLCRAAEIAIVIDDTSENDFSRSLAIASDVYDNLRALINSGRAVAAFVTSEQTVSNGVVSDLRLPSGTNNNNRLLKALGRAANFFDSPDRSTVNVFRSVLVIHSGKINMDAMPAMSENEPMNPDSILDVVYRQLKRDRNAYIYSLPLSSASAHGREMLRRLHSLSEPMINADIYSLPLSFATVHGREVLRRLHSLPGPMLNADIYSLPMSSATVHGREVLRRLHSLPGPMLDSDVDYLAHLQDHCPQFEPCQAVDMVFMLDVSGSVNIAQVRSRALQTLRMLREQSDLARRTNVAMVSFAEHTTIHSDLENGALSDNASYSYLESTINSRQISQQGMSNLALAAMTVANMVFNNHGDRNDGVNMVVIFSDGQANMQTYANSQALAMLRDVAVVWIYPGPDTISTPYTDRTFADITSRLTSETFAQDIPTSINSNENCPVLEILDCNLMLVFDASGSISDQSNRNTYISIRTLAANIAEDYYRPVTAGNARRLGVIKFSENSEMVLTFEDYSQAGAQRVRDAVDTIRTAVHIGGLTNMVSALQMAAGMAPGGTIVVIGDGEWNRGGDAANKVGELVRSGYRVYFVFYGDRYAQQQEQIKRNLPDGHSLKVMTSQELLQDSTRQWVQSSVGCN